MSDACEVAELAGAHAIVLFADDYAAEEVRAVVRRFPARLAVIVTSRGAEFDALKGDLPDAVVVLPQPTWGWALLEAVRSGVSRLSAPS